MWGQLLMRAPLPWFSWKHAGNLCHDSRQIQNSMVAAKLDVVSMHDSEAMMESLYFILGGAILGILGVLLIRAVVANGDYRDKDTIVIKEKGGGGNTKIVIQPKTIRLYEGGELKYRNELEHQVKIRFTTTRDSRLGPFAERAGETRGRFKIPAGAEDARDLDVRGGGLFARSWNFEATVNNQKIDPRVKVKRG